MMHARLAAFSAPSLTSSRSAHSNVVIRHASATTRKSVVVRCSVETLTKVAEVAPATTSVEDSPSILESLPTEDEVVTVCNLPTTQQQSQQEAHNVLPTSSSQEEKPKPAAPSRWKKAFETEASNRGTLDKLPPTIDYLDEFQLKTCDTTITFKDGTVLPAHAYLLCFHSPEVLGTMLQSDDPKPNNLNIDAGSDDINAWKLLLSRIHNQPVSKRKSLSRSNIEHVTQLAAKYKISLLMEECEAFLTNPVNEAACVDPSKSNKYPAGYPAAHQWLKFCIQYNLMSLQQFFMDFMLDSYVEMCDQNSTFYGSYRYRSGGVQQTAQNYAKIISETVAGHPALMQEMLDRALAKMQK